MVCSGRTSAERRLRRQLDWLKSGTDRSCGGRGRNSGCARNMKPGCKPASARFAQSRPVPESSAWAGFGPANRHVEPVRRSLRCFSGQCRRRRRTSSPTVGSRDRRPGIVTSAQVWPATAPPRASTCATSCDRVVSTSAVTASQAHSASPAPGLGQPGLAAWAKRFRPRPVARSNWSGTISFGHSAISAPESLSSGPRRSVLHRRLCDALNGGRRGAESGTRSRTLAAA